MTGKEKPFKVHGPSALAKAGGILASNGRCPHCAKRSLHIGETHYSNVSTLCAKASCSSCKRRFVITYTLTSSREI